MPPRCRPTWPAVAAGLNFIATIDGALSLTASLGVFHSYDGAGNATIWGSAGVRGCAGRSGSAVDAVSGGLQLPQRYLMGN